jgi:O-antigen ligase
MYNWVQRIKEYFEKMQISVPELAMLAGLFCLPFELAITQAAHGVFFKFIGNLYYLIHPFTLVFISALILAKKHFSVRNRILNFVLLLLLSAIGGILIAGVAFDSPMILISRLVWFGFCAVIVAYLTFQSSNRIKLLFVLAVGISGWALLAILTYMYDLNTVRLHFPEILNYDWPQLLISMKMPGSNILREFWFDEIIGNGNKASNVLMTGFVIATYLYIKGSLNFSFLVVLLFPMILLLCLIFSRGAFVVSLLLAATFFALGLIEQVTSRNSVLFSKFVLASMLLFIPGAYSISNSHFLNYWFDSVSAVYRIQQAEDIVSDLNDRGRGGFSLSAGDSVKSKALPRLLFGYGVGNYGLERFNSADRMTHNLFLDSWAEGGLLSLISVASLFLLGMLLGFKQYIANRNLENLFGFLGLGVIFVLAFREYEMSYLKATSMSAFVFGIFLALATNVRHPVKDQNMP